MKTVYKIEFSRVASKQLRKLPNRERDRIISAIKKLAENPFPHGCIKLSNDENAYRIKVGNYRVIYDVYRRVLTVEIVKVGHRREVYR